MTRIADWLLHNYEALYDQENTTYKYIITEPQHTRMGFTVGMVQNDWFEQTFVPAFTPTKSSSLTGEIPGREPN
jgi:hypothetical protein